MDRVTEGWVSVSRLTVICGCCLLFSGDGFWNLSGAVGVILAGIMMTWQSAWLERGVLLLVSYLVALACCAMLVGEFLEFADTRQWGAVFRERVGAVLAVSVCGGMLFGLVSTRMRVPDRLRHAGGAVLALFLVSAMVLTVAELPLSATVPVERGDLDIPHEWTNLLTAGIVAGGVIGFGTAMVARRRDDALAALVGGIGMRVGAAVALAGVFWGCVLVVAGMDGVAELPAQALFAVMTIMGAWVSVLLSAVLDGFALARSGILWKRRGKSASGRRRHGKSLSGGVERTGEDARIVVTPRVGGRHRHHIAVATGSGANGGER